MKKMMKRAVLGVVGAVAALGLGIGAVAAPAQAATYYRNSYCTGLSSTIDVRTPSSTAISVQAWSLKTGAYLGSRLHNGTRMHWSNGGSVWEDVKFKVVTGINASSISTTCGLTATYITR